jgi:hypothetical protein
MDVVIYGAEKVPPGIRVVKSVEELRRHVGKAFLVVVGDRKLAEELGAVYFSEEEWGEFLTEVYGSPQAVPTARNLRRIEKGAELIRLPPR